MGETGAETSTGSTGFDEVPGSDDAGPPEARTGGSPANAGEQMATDTERSADAAEQMPLAPAIDEAVLLEALGRLDDRLAESQRLLDRQNGLIDRLHAENQGLRAGELRSAQLPLVRDLLRLHDDLGRMRESAEEDGDLRIVQESLADTLARNGVVAFEPDGGDELDSRMHSVARSEATADQDLDRTVAGVVKQGFRWESGEVIRVAEVMALRFE